MDLGLLSIVLFFVILGAMIKGLAGFGFGILGTTLLAGFIPVQDAVTVMILPLLAVNIPLILEAEFSQLKKCVESFKFFLLTGLTGSFLGVILVDFLPLNLLALTVGVLAVLYVYFKQSIIYRPEIHVSLWFTEKWYGQTITGVFAGLVFAASNIGLMFVSYLERLKVDRETFVGLLSLLIFSATVVRVSASMNVGLYTPELFTVSVLAAFVGIVVSELSAKISHRISQKRLTSLTLVLILVAGLRIIWNQLGSHLLAT